MHWVQLSANQCHKDNNNKLLCLVRPRRPKLLAVYTAYTGGPAMLCYSSEKCQSSAGPPALRQCQECEASGNLAGTYKGLLMSADPLI